MSEKKMEALFSNLISSAPSNESALHIMCVQYAQRRGCLLNHCHNEFFFLMDNSRKFGQMNKAKQMGSQKGYPDLNIFLENGVTLFFEFKHAKNGLSPAQVIWRDELLKKGFKWHLIRDFDTFKEILDNELKGGKN